MNGIVKVLEGISPKPRIEYYTRVTFENGETVIYWPPDLDEDDYCDLNRCICQGIWRKYEEAL